MVKTVYSQERKARSTGARGRAVRRVALGILAGALLVGCAPVCRAAEEPPAISAASAVLLCADTGECLFEQNADEPMLIASTTKLMTALVVLQNCAPDEQVEILAEDAAVEGSSMYLAPGEVYSVEELLYGLMLASGNDAALALARYVGGSVEGFADLMNEEAAWLGLQHSAFRNPHGLDEEGHYSCARDLALIMRALMEDELFREISRTRTFSCRDLTYVNHNRLLWDCEGVIAGKTGYTIAAGRSLVSCCERDGLRLICVTLSDPDDWTDHAQLYDWACGNFVFDDPLGSFARFSVPVLSGETGRVTIAQAGPFRVLREKDASVELKTGLPRFVFAPVGAGQEAGTVEVWIDGEKRGEVQMVYRESIQEDESLALTRWEQFRRIWYLSMRYGGFSYPMVY